jgi:hypothetical protein
MEGHGSPASPRHGGGETGRFIVVGYRLQDPVATWRRVSGPLGNRSATATERRGDAAAGQRGVETTRPRG